MVYNFRFSVPSWSTYKSIKHFVSSSRILYIQFEYWGKFLLNRMGVGNITHQILSTWLLIWWFFSCNFPIMHFCSLSSTSVYNQYRKIVVSQWWEPASIHMPSSIFTYPNQDKRDKTNHSIDETRNKPKIFLTPDDPLYLSSSTSCNFLSSFRN